MSPSKTHRWLTWAMPFSTCSQQDFSQQQHKTIAGVEEALGPDTAGRPWYTPPCMGVGAYGPTSPRDPANHPLFRKHLRSLASLSRQGPATGGSQASARLFSCEPFLSGWDGGVSLFRQSSWILFRLLHVCCSVVDLCQSCLILFTNNLDNDGVLFSPHIWRGQMQCFGDWVTYLYVLRMLLYEITILKCFLSITYLLQVFAWQ